MISVTFIESATAKVLAVFSANKGDKMKMEQITCLGERQ